MAFVKVSVGDSSREAGWKGSAGTEEVATRPLNCSELTKFYFAAALESSSITLSETPSSPVLAPFTALVYGPQSLSLWLHGQRADVIVPCHKTALPLKWQFSPVGKH